MRLKLAPGIIADVYAFDPVTLTAIAATASAVVGAGSLANSILNKPATPTIPQAAPPIQSPVGTQSSNTQSQGPSFLAAAATPQGNQASGAKSLLGQ